VERLSISVSLQVKCAVYHVRETEVKLSFIQEERLSLRLELPCIGQNIYCVFTAQTLDFLQNLKLLPTDIKYEFV